MSLRNLTNLLSPSRIAVVGGSDRVGTVGKVVVDNILAGGFRGDVYVVNPRAQVIDGAQWLANVDHLPDGVDLAIVVTPAAFVPETIEKLGARGVAAAMVISAAVTGRAREAMLAAAHTSGLRIIGPNGLGLIAPHTLLNASFARGAPRPGRLGLISQSGALVSGVIDWANARGLGFSAIISAGDMADVDFGDMIDLLAADPHTDAILLYVEGVTDAAKMLSAAHAATRFKPVIVLKAGKTASGRRAAASHTGALAGDDAVHRCAFARAGMVGVENLTDLFEAAEALRIARRPQGPALAIVTNGGGAGVLAADAMAAGPLELASLSPATRKRLDGVLPPAWSHGDPVDLLGDAAGERYATAIAAVLDDDAVDALLIINCPTALNEPAVLAQAIGRAVQAARGRGRFKPVIGCWLGETNRRCAEAALAAAGVPVFETPDAAVQAFAHLLRAGHGRQGLAATPRAPEGRARRDAAQAIIDAARLGARALLSEVETKAILKLYGVPTIETRRATDAAGVAAACEGLAGPYVVKVISPQISHKSDVGGVALNLPDAAAATMAARDMAARLARERPDAQLDGFAVETMAPSGGHELIVGMTEDAIFGPVVAVGAGGKAVEVLADQALGLPPLDTRLAKAMIASTRVSRLLVGYRDEPAADLDAVAAIIEAVSALTTDLPDIVELDINPLRVDAKGALALDARMVVATHQKSARLAILPPPAEAWDVLTTHLGQTVQVRPAGPDDKALLADFFSRLSAEDMRLRFLSPVRSLDDERLSLMCDLDYRRVMTFLAFDSRDDALLATAMLAGGPDPTRAEVALAVRSDLKGQGLGWTLLDHALDYARARGIKTVESVESADNGPALRLEAEMGFSSRVSPDDTGLRIVERLLEANDHGASSA